MQEQVPSETTVARIVVSSERLLVSDYLTHHFSTASFGFEMVAGPTHDLDPSIPTVCILDVGRKAFGTLEKTHIISRMCKTTPSARILVISGHPDIWEAPDWIASGAHGYFATRSGPELLTAATIVVAAGGIFIPEDLARRLLTRRPQNSGSA